MFSVCHSISIKVESNNSCCTDGSRSACASTGATTHPSEFTTFINSPEGDSLNVGECWRMLGNNVWVCNT